MDTANITTNDTKINIKYQNNAAIREALMCRMLMQYFV